MSRLDVLFVVALEEELGHLCEVLECNGVESPDINRAFERIDSTDAVMLPFDLPIGVLYTWRDQQEQGQEQEVKKTDDDVLHCGAIVLQRMGSVESSTRASSALAALKPALVVSYGCAGGLYDEVKYCDVVIANQVMDVQQGEKQKDGGVVLPSLNVVVPTGPVTMNAELIMGGRDQRTRKVYKVAIYESLLRHLEKDEDVSRDDMKKYFQLRDSEIKAVFGDTSAKSFKKPHVHVGHTMSTSGVITDSSFKKRMQDKDRKVLCVEMEAYGVASACALAKTPLVVVKGISDLADANKNEMQEELREAFRAGSIRHAAMVALSIVATRTTAVESIKLTHKQRQNNETVSSAATVSDSFNVKINATGEHLDAVMTAVARAQQAHSDLIGRSDIKTYKGTGNINLSFVGDGQQGNNDSSSSSGGNNGKPQGGNWKP
eukprot:TRINITY_DN66936_c1_g1_i1.p1 TRINITY_DN66936_c1_g1~~TRINITY_DN66936_c1_g1_i1.p1  ORF type:complete len:433 (+),score=187.31 TRINITY_DN66936_c1_g1_i1:54-1352(+)